MKAVQNLAGVFVTIAALLLAACSSSSSPAPSACTPGATQACACSGGATGVQACTADGSGYGACGGCAAADSGSDAGCSQNGAAACNQFTTAWCARLVKCCNPTGGSLSACNAKCQNLVAGSGVNYNACTLDACNAWNVREGIDCSTSRYTSKTVCESMTTTCVDDVPLVACSDLTGGTANPPASCKAFLAQF